MPSPIERKLAAIMFTDIAGYTEQMSKSESKTLNLLEKKRSILKPLLKKYRGTFVKEIGDGTLSYFESAVNAATCAVKLQETTYDDEEINIRVGIHIGDIVFKAGDVFGGGVNVASRLESIAPAGGVCVSKSVYDELANQDEFDGIELGLQSLKGVGRLIEVFGLKGDKLNEPNPDNYLDCLCTNCNCKQVPCCCDEMPSIAVIPFRNKGKEEDAFYAYGICSDIIADISSAGLIRVASLEEIEELGEIPFKEKARKLFVRYVVTGTLWKMDGMFQLSLELFDTKNSNVLWSDRWQENWENLPSIKENLVSDLLKAVNSKHELNKRQVTSNAEAYEYYLQGKYKMIHRQNMEDISIAEGLFKKAIELDDNLVEARQFLGFIYLNKEDFDTALVIYSTLLKQSEQIEDKKGIGIGLLYLGAVYASKGDYDKALEYANRALIIQEEINNIDGVAISLGGIGFGYLCKGEYNKALEYSKRSIEIKKKFGDQIILAYEISQMGSVYYYQGCYKQAVECLEESLVVQKKNEAFAKQSQTILYLYLAYKKLGKQYDIEVIHEAVKRREELKEYSNDFHNNYHYYKLLEKPSYLESSYNRVQELADNLEPNIKAKFLSYPIPKAIVEEWEKVK